MEQDRKDKLYMTLLFFVSLLSRIPFLFVGYGSEEDSWGIVRAVRHNLEQGGYEPSRFPGHPIHEAFYLLGGNLGPLFYNGLTALVSAFAVLFFAMSLRKMGVKSFLVASYALAFIPVFFISSTYTIDYNWTLAFTLLSFYFLLDNKFILSGIFLGFACGCRLTAAAMIIPYLFYVYNNRWKLNVTLDLIFGFGITSFLAYLPMIVIYHSKFLVYYDQFAYPTLAKVFYKGTLGVFGVIGCLGIIFALILILLNKFKTKGLFNFSKDLPSKFIGMCFLIIAIYIVAYLRLPQKSGYMVQVLPFVILLFAIYLEKKYFHWLCYSFILSSFLFSINLTDEKRGSQHSKFAFTFSNSGQELFLDPFTGPVYADYTKRIQKELFTNEVIEKYLDNRYTPMIIISGWWCNEINVTLKERKLIKKLSPFVSYWGMPNIMNDAKHGLEVYYLPEQDKFNDEYAKINFTDSVAKPFMNEK